MPDYDALLVPKQIGIITESVQAMNDICVSLETENAAISTAAEALVAALTQVSDDHDGLDYYEAKKIADFTEYWSHIEDAWLMWLDAIEYAKPTKEQILDLDMAVNLAGYFVEEHQDDDTEQWHTDNKRVATARAILQDMKGKP